MSTASPGRTWRSRWNGVSASRWVDSETLRLGAAAEVVGQRAVLHVLVAEQPADVVEGGRVGAAGEHDLGEVVGEHAVGEPAVGGVELGLGLPDRDEQDADAGAGGGDLGEPGERHVAGLVDDHQQRPAEPDAGDVALVGLILEVAEQAAEHRREALLVVERRDEVQRVRLVPGR